MGDKLLTLEEWAEAVYGKHRPNLDTLRRWARQARIYPLPEKHGRTYFVIPTARHIDPNKPIVTPKKRAPSGPLVERIRGKTA
ncbi:excisionase [Azospirillum sp. B21]|uniref:excisionase n=1 Tax=Azospirillum sp. B21 TaxID=2607496 RepID=UPI0011EE7685|nr:excisionase [Azospirillum sp. B21]KAA0572259.1 excisionase [Azospirillum sp. B21]